MYRTWLCTADQAPCLVHLVAHTPACVHNQHRLLVAQVTRVSCLSLVYGRIWLVGTR